jgi:hypothetical protein
MDYSYFDHAVSLILPTSEGTKLSLQSFKLPGAMDRDQTLLARLQRQRIIMANQMSGEPGVGTNQMIAAQQPYMHTPASGVMGQQMMTHWNPYLL